MAERRWIGRLSWGAVALLAGVVIGGVGPRAALREARAELARVDPKRCERAAVGREVARAIATGIAKNDAARATRPRPAPPPVEPEAPVASTAPPESPATAITGSIELPAPDPAEAEEARLAADTLDLRQRQAFAAFVEQARPSAAQLAAIEDVVDAMNAELAVVAEDLFALVASGEEPTRLDWMVFASDFLDVFIEAEMSLSESLTDEQLASVDPAVLDPFSFIDGRVAESLERFHSGGD